MFDIKCAPGQAVRRERLWSVFVFRATLHLCTIITYLGLVALVGFGGGKTRFPVGLFCRHAFYLWVLNWIASKSKTHFQRNDA